MRPDVLLRLVGPVALWGVAGVACGGTAIVDPVDDDESPDSSSMGTRGSGASPTGTTTTSAAGGAPATTSSGTAAGGDCAALEQQMLAAYDEAIACDPLINAIQCSGMNLAKGYCDCAVVANDLTPELAAESLALGDAWADSGCEYNFCEGGCYPADAPWFCNPATNRCEPTYE